MTAEHRTRPPGTAADETEPWPRRLPPTRELLKFAFRALFGVGLLVAFVVFIDFGAAVTAIRGIPVFWAVAAFAAAVLSSIIIPAIITRQTLQTTGISLRTAELILINFGMRFYVLMLPHAITVGLRWQRYRTDPSHGWQAATLILFERLVQLQVLVLAAFGFLLWSYPSVPERLLVFVPLSGLASVVATAVVALFVSTRVYGLANPLVSWVERRGPRFISGRVQRLRSAVEDFHRLPRKRVVAVFCWAVVAHGLFVTSAWFVARGLGIDIDFATIGWMRSAVFLVTVLPITVGGLGVREVGFATLLRLQGVNDVSSASFPLVLLAIQLGIGLIGAATELVRTLRGGRYV